MTDIVERLREYAGMDNRPSSAWMREAADEIERLLAESDLALAEATRLLESFVHEHCSPVPEWKPLPDLMGVLSQLSNAVTITRTYKTEIERLRELKTPASRQLLNITKGCLDDAEAEIERLRADARACASVIVSEENERLRANIKEMAAVTGKQLDERNKEIERLQDQIDLGAQ